MKKKEFLLRVVIGVGCIIVFTLLVFWRQHIVQTQRDQTIVSTISEWKTYGKPIVVENIAHEDMQVYEKITITPLSQTLFEGYVTKDIQEQLRPGQTVSVDTEQGKRVFGVISCVGQALNVDTGMFRVRAVFDHEVASSNHIVVAYVHTGTLKDVISIPNEIIADNDGEFFIWTVRDGHAYKQNILLGERNGYGAVVLQGLRDGDMVVTAGQTQLSDGDKVRIVDNKELERHMP
jgi:multidrug efflux pump subunit AcrA (membrane-fusion protein)